MAWPFSKTKAAPDEREPSDTPTQPDIIYLDNGIGVGIIKWNDRIQAEAALAHPIVSRALDKIASSVQQVKWKIQKDPDVPSTVSRGNERRSAALQSVLDNPNDNMTPKQLRYWMALNYMCYGRIPYKVGFSAINRADPSGVYPLEAKHVRVELTAGGTPKRYHYGFGEAASTAPSRQAVEQGDGSSFVDQIWKPALRGYQHPDELNSPLRSVGLPAQVIKSLLIRAIQTAEGHPNVRYLVTCSRNLNEQQKQALRKHLNEDHGPEGPDTGKVPILQNAGDVVIHTLDNDLSDIHSKAPSDDMARLIFGAFGIPIALAGMGAADGAKFAGNYVESRQSFWQDTIIPMYVTPIFEGLTLSLCPLGLKVEPNYDDVPAMVAARTSSMKTVSEVPFLTVNEKREMFGLAAVAGGDVIAPPATNTNGGQNGQT